MMAIERTIDQNRKAKHSLASPAHCGYPLRCGGGEGSWVVMTLTQAGVAEEEVVELGSVASSGRIARYSLQWSRIYGA